MNSTKTPSGLQAPLLFALWWLLFVAAGPSRGAVAAQSDWTILPTSEGYLALRAFPPNTSAKPYWSPNRGDIEQAEAILPAYLSKQGDKRLARDLDRYLRQYVGFTLHGRRLIYLGAFPKERCPKLPDGATCLSVPEMFFNGGEDVWDAEYDPHAKRWFGLRGASAAPLWTNLPASQGDLAGRKLLEGTSGKPYWSPKRGDIEQAEAVLPEFLRKEGHERHARDLDRYLRQYVGFTLYGRQLIYLSAFPKALVGLQYCPHLPGCVDWRSVGIQIFDGGESVWQAVYDPRLEQWFGLRFNGVA